MFVRSNIALIGMAGAGKTFLGKALAQRLSLRFVDTDDLVVLRSGKNLPIGELPKHIGDSAFLDLENDTRHELASYSNTVIATGGSYVYLPEAMNVLRDVALVIFLLESFDVINQRARDRGPGYRLVGQGNRSLFELFIDRNKRYRQYAHHTVNVAALNHDADAVLDAITRLAAEHSA